MSTILSGKHFGLNKPLKNYINAKLKNAVRYSPLPIKDMKVELDVDKNQRSGLIHRVEISLILPGKIIKAGQKAEHMREAIDLCFPKIYRQLKKYKTQRFKSKNPGGKTVRKSKLIKQ